MKLRKSIEAAINANSAESGSNTPDFILAEFLTDCLAAWDKAHRARTTWYGPKGDLMPIGAGVAMQQKSAGQIEYERVSGQTDWESMTGPRKAIWEEMATAVKRYPVHDYETFCAQSPYAKLVSDAVDRIGKEFVDHAKDFKDLPLAKKPGSEPEKTPTQISPGQCAYEAACGDLGPEFIKRPWKEISATSKAMWNAAARRNQTVGGAEHNLRVHNEKLVAFLKIALEAIETSDKNNNFAGTRNNIEKAIQNYELGSVVGL